MHTTTVLDSLRRWSMLALIAGMAGACVTLRQPSGTPTKISADLGPTRRSAPLVGRAQASAGDHGQEVEASLWELRSRAARLRVAGIALAQGHTAGDLAEKLRAGEIRSLAVEGAQWVPLGPSPISASFGRHYVGRVDSVAIDRDRPGTLYLGSPNGGIWRSQDAGAHWTLLTDGQCSQSIEALALDPADGRILFAGTGYGFSGALGGFNSYPPCGLLKSTDQGNHWTRLEIDGSPEVHRISIDPSFAGDPAAETLLVSTELGVYRSTDGGGSFAPVLASKRNPRFTSLDDLERDPAQPSVVYAAVLMPSQPLDPNNPVSSFVYKSSDGGRTWLQASAGLPTSGLAGLALAIAPAASSTLYAVGEANSGARRPRLFKSRDGAGSWVEITPAGDTLVCNCFYDLTLAVDRADPDVVFFGGVDLYVSTDGAQTWRAKGVPHADFHAFVFDSAGKLYAGNDGGLNASADRGENWSELNTDQSITQVYFAALHPSDAARTLIGTQDNGTILSTGTPPWSTVFGGDGGYPLFGPGSSSTLYVEIQSPAGPFFFRSDDGGKTIYPKMDGVDLTEGQQFFVPVGQSTAHPETLFLATSRVYRSDNRGDRWEPVSPPLAPYGLQTLAISETSPPAVYVAGYLPNDNNGHIWASAEGSTGWNDITIGNPFGEAVISGIAVDRFDPHIVYAVLAVSSKRSSVYRTIDGGASWTDISGNLPPGTAVSSIALIEPSPSSCMVVLSAAGGVFVSAAGGGSWKLMSSGLPAKVPVAQVRYSETTSRLVAATYGRGLYELSCAPSPTVLCLAGGRFRVGVQWSTSSGLAGVGQAVALSADTGYFWFFNPANVEMAVKVLDGCSVSGKFWVFAGGLTNVHTVISVTDNATGKVKTYTNPADTPFQPIADTSAFDTCGAAFAASLDASPRRSGPAVRTELGGCGADATDLCLAGGRFRVAASWKTPQGQTGSAQAVSLTGDTGYFWFFSAANLEMVVKVLDGCGLNGRYWVFAGGLTNVDVHLSVTDTASGAVREYVNNGGRLFQPIQDTQAFASCP